MLSKVPDSILEQIETDQKEIILNGPPGRLSGSVQLHNRNDDSARLRFIDLKPTKTKKTKSVDEAPLYVNTRLRAGESRLENISISLPIDTPPGTYDQYITLGGKQQKVKMVVQPLIAIDIQPSSFTFQGTAAGTKHLAQLTVTNTGNMPFQIPEVKHVAPLDMDLLCRAFGYGFRKDPEEGFTATMDHVTQNLKEHLPDWARSEVKQAGKIIETGQSMLVEIEVTLPKQAQEKNDYDLLLRFWDEEIAMTFKSHTA
ncbi:COG1470 family protein [Croceiramulus getboli]|nr:hypothetical protein P8624_10705 [Flavobacteriaceae bacterium YJPT1-3]